MCEFGKGEQMARQARGYVERYARLSAANCEANFRRKMPDCCWTNGRQDDDFARLRIVKFALDFADVKVVFDFEEAHLRVPESQRFHLKRLDPLNGYRKPFFICPECRLPFDWMIAKDGRWACRLCHHLCHRTQRLSADDRRMLRLRELERLLQPIKNQCLRPKGMRHARFDALTEEWRLLKNWAKTQPSRTIQADIGLVLEARWEPSTAAPL